MVGRLFRLISPHGGELNQMVAVAFCLTVAWISEHLGLSIELGAFVAGVMISATPYAEQTLHHIEPIRNVFAALFLASIGMIMNPFFLWVHLDVLLASLLVVIVFKCSLITLVVRAFGYSTRTSFTVGMSMAQVGEFSFVLLSRASNLGLVQRKLYLLLLGTTALSLVATPIMFRCTPYMLRLAFHARWIKREEEDAVEQQVWAPPGSPNKTAAGKGAGHGTLYARSDQNT
jgi:Kef-type K+ transport system membrane component KefB